MTETGSTPTDENFVWALQKPTMTENGRNLTNLFRIENVDEKLLPNSSAVEPFLKPVLHESGAPSRKHTPLRTRFDESIFVINKTDPAAAEERQRLSSNLDNLYQVEENHVPTQANQEEEEKPVSQNLPDQPETIPLKPGVSASEVVGFFLDKVTQNKGQIRLNCFLFVLLGLIMTAIVVFVVVEPEEHDSYEMHLSHFATFWPLKRRLSVHHSFSGDFGSLELMWGYHVPETGNAVPSYCSKRGGADCETGNCCLRYPGHSRLYLSSFTFGSTNCVGLQWMKEEDIPGEIFYFTDCIFTRGRDWYGGLMELNVSWPVTWINSSEFRLVLTGHDKGIGVVEPLWMSGDGFSVRVDSSGPLLWNYTQDYFCLKSINTFNYTVCEADRLDHLYLTARRNDEPFTNSSNERLKSHLGKMYLGLNATEISHMNPEEISELEDGVGFLWKKLPLAESFIFAFEDTHIFEHQHTQKTADFMRNLKKVSSQLQTSVEVNNFVSLQEVQRNHNYWEKLVWQNSFEETPRSTGLVVWRDRLCEVLDISRTRVAQWFLSEIRNWTLYAEADYAMIAGGYASLLPAAAELNVTDENGNFYTHQYAKMAADLESAILISTGFQSQPDPFYTTVTATCHNVDSVIPTALSLSILGYAHLALDIKLTSHNCHSSILRHLLELSMFFPVSKTPIDLFLPGRKNGTFHKSSSFQILEETLTLFSHVRQNYTLPHYRRAMEEFLLHKTPIIRPMWWTQSSLSQENRKQTLSIHTQFMIGSDMVVVAFIGHPGVDNKIYLPQGTWHDPLWNGGTVHIPFGQYIIYASNSPLACFVKLDS